MRVTRRRLEIVRPHAATPILSGTSHRRVEKRVDFVGDRLEELSVGAKPGFTDDFLDFGSDDDDLVRSRRSLGGGTHGKTKQEQRANHLAHEDDCFCVTRGGSRGWHRSEPDGAWVGLARCTYS